MLVNAPDFKPEHVKFISYTGKWPNLCRGILTLEIDGQTVTFGNDDTCDNYKAPNADLTKLTIAFLVSVAINGFFIAGILGNWR